MSIGIRGSRQVAGPVFTHLAYLLGQPLFNVLDLVARHMTIDEQKVVSVPSSDSGRRLLLKSWNSCLSDVHMSDAKAAALFRMFVKSRLIALIKWQKSSLPLHPST
jgi:hypothetical protein